MNIKNLFRNRATKIREAILNAPTDQEAFGLFSIVHQPIPHWIEFILSCFIFLGTTLGGLIVSVCMFYTEENPMITVDNKKLYKIINS